MQTYLNRSGNSGVKEFKIGIDYVEVKFNSGKVYKYSYISAGALKVEQMKTLALAGCSLNSYINRFARNDYEK